MDSPSVSKKNRPRRSLSMRTPLRKVLRGDPVSVDSPEILFGDSPGTCSTPVNHQRKRIFMETDSVSPYLGSSSTGAESPMDVSGLHYQTASPSLMAYPTMSQEMRKLGVDVVWQWNSPKTKNTNQNSDQEVIHPAARKRRKSFTAHSSSTTTELTSQSSECATGFYKIREELLRAKKEDSLFMRLLQEDDFPAASAVEAKEKDVTLTRKLSDELLNDSDNDENLLIISQETEKKVMEQEQQQQQQQMLGRKKTATSAIRNRETSFAANDSFDQFLIDIPFDELLNRNAGALEETIVNTSNSTPMPRVVGGRKGSLSRTQSMPPDKKGDSSAGGCSSTSGIGTSSGSNNGSRTMARHESMPYSGRSSSNSSGNSKATAGSLPCASKYSVSNPSLPVIPMSSSTESLHSATSSTEKTRVCSQTEIARKRKIAQERLKLKQQQQMKNKSRPT